MDLIFFEMFMKLRKIHDFKKGKETEEKTAKQNRKKKSPEGVEQEAK